MLNKQDQGSTALPFYIFLDVPDWIGAMEETGLRRKLDWGFINWNLYALVINVLMYICLKFQSHRLNIIVPRTLLYLLGLWRTLEVPDWIFITWTIYEWVIYVLMYLCLKLQSHRLNIRMQRTLLSLLSSLGLWRTLYQLINSIMRL